MASIAIRGAEPGDIGLILSFVRELAEYERAPEQAVATPEQMRRALFGDPAVDGRGAGVAECVIGLLDGEPQGFALFFHNFSTWSGRPGVYLEDLFVRPSARGSGLGRALLVHLAKIAVDRGCGRFEWSVLDWNEPALGFYRSLGAELMKEWIIHRVSGVALGRLAEMA